MRRLFYAVVLVLPLIPLVLGYVHARRFFDERLTTSTEEESLFVLEAVAGVSEPVISRPSVSRTELFELGRRVDTLQEVHTVVLLYRSPSEAQRTRLEVAYRTPGAEVAESADWESLLESLIEQARSESRNEVGDISKQLQDLGRQIVDAIVEGNGADSQTLARLDRQFKQLYEEGNSRLSRVSRSLQTRVTVPTGRPGGEGVGFYAQPVLSFARSQNVEVLGVVLVEPTPQDDNPLYDAFFLRLGSLLLLAYLLSLLGIGLWSWGRRKKANNV